MSSKPLSINLSDSSADTFDYGILDTESRQRIQVRTSEIKHLIHRSAQDIIDIGEHLVGVKVELGHGNFEKWLSTEFDWSIATARRFMQVFEQFKSLNLSDLNIATSALYLLAKSSVPEKARDEAITRAEQGENITLSTAKEIVLRQHTTQDLPKAESLPSPEPLPPIRPENAIIDIEAEIIRECMMPQSPESLAPKPKQPQSSAHRVIGDRVSFPLEIEGETQQFEGVVQDVTVRYQHQGKTKTVRIPLKSVRFET
jgi:hypothetical protein